MISHGGLRRHSSEAQHSEHDRSCLLPRFGEVFSGQSRAPTQETAMANPKLEVLTPQNSQLIFIDQQPQMAFGVQSIDRQVLKNNTVALAKAAKIFNIPTTITTVESQ